MEAKKSSSTNFLKSTCACTKHRLLYEQRIGILEGKIRREAKANEGMQRLQMVARVYLTVVYAYGGDGSRFNQESLVSNCVPAGLFGEDTAAGAYNETG